MANSLYERIGADLDAHRRARTDMVAVNLLNTLKGEAAKVGKDAGNRQPTDDETVAVVRKFVKNLEQTIADLAKVGREASSQLHEIDILKPYLPVGLSEDEIRVIVRDVVAANPDKVEQVRAKPGNVGWFVGQVMKAAAGKADAKVVADVLRSELG